MDTPSDHRVYVHLPRQHEPLYPSLTCLGIEPKWNIIRQGHPDAEKQQRQSDMVSRYHHEDIQSEQAIYKILQSKPPRPYIVQSLLLALEATFIQRLPNNLEARLKTTPLPCQKLEAQWIKGIIDGVVWLESLGLVHGDLRPGNSLLDMHDHVKLCAFDCTVEHGGSTIYTVVTKRLPFHGLDDDEVEQRFAKMNSLLQTAYSVAI